MKIKKRATPRYGLADVAYFNADKMGRPSWSYVCWLDVMGMRSRMVWSDAISANGIFKLYNAAVRACKKAGHPSGFRLYPVMDGAFLTAERWQELADVVRETMRLYAGTFLITNSNALRFMIRGGMSYGPIYHGSGLKHEADTYLAAQPDIRNAIVIGTPVLSAYTTERGAPPFGIGVDRCLARRFETGEDEDSSVDTQKGLYHWHLATGKLAGELVTAIREYYTWYRKFGSASAYPPKERAEHLRSATSYFTFRLKGSRGRDGATK